MNKLLSLFAVVLLSLSFAMANQDDASAGDLTNTDISADGDVLSPIVVPITAITSKPSIDITLISPVSSSFITPSGKMSVPFLFSFTSDFLKAPLLPADVLATAPDMQVAQILVDDSMKCSVIVKKDGVFVKSLDTVLSFADTHGKSSGDFDVASYKWSVSCNNNFGTWNSVETDFSVNLEPAIVTVPIVEVTAQVPVPASSSDDEGNGRRVNPLALTPLSNPNANPIESLSEETSNSRPAGITGAVIGAFGEKGALGIGIFITVLGVVALAVYNRQRFGLVK